MTPWLDRLQSIAGRPATVVGLLSGTSADAIEAAVCRIDPAGDRVALIVHTSHPHDPAVHGWIAGAGALGARGIAELHRRLGARFGDACLEAIATAGLRPYQVDLVGSHGQTLYHHSQVPGAERCSLQVGDADEIAERTGLPVVADFRARDIAAGGEGAPISPIADVVLFRPSGPLGRRAVLNLGGIANLTILDDDPGRVLGFDAGPGNALMDRLARRISGGRLAFDRDGLVAAGGTVDEALLRPMLDDDPFLSRSPPKSSGFEMYGDAYLGDLIARRGRADADLMATLSEFTARAVGRAVAEHVDPARRPAEVVVAGGGALNPDLMARLARALAPATVTRSDALGVPPLAREAMAFAILAHRALLGAPSTWPALTGARRPVVLGKLSFPGA